MSSCPSLAELPPPPSGKTGWPWTAESSPLPETISDLSGVEGTNTSPWPRISIVTPSYNQGQFIEETIRSILLQGYPNLEYIIIDGDSTDETVQIIKKYERWLKFWISEPDRGQSHAINKGLDHCSGEIFNWINSDDMLAPGALFTVAKTWSRAPHKIIAGAAINFDKDGFEELHSPNAITLENFVNWRKARESGWMWQQPSTFLPRAEVSKVGGAREDLQLNMDHFLMIDLLQHCDVVYVPNVLARFRLHGDSKTMMYGCLQFSLERLARLREMKGLQKYVTSKELKELQVSVLLTLAEQQGSNRQYDLAFKNCVKAFVESPFFAIVIILRRSAFGRFIQNIRGRASNSVSAK